MKDGAYRIGIFGGTFDPVHNGHVSAAESFLNSGAIDHLWVLLNPAPPHKPDVEHASYSDRFAMLQKAFESIESVKISDVETRLPAPCYTIRSLQYLTDSYPKKDFYLCIGYDSFINFQSWYKWEKILELSRLLVVERPTFSENVPDQKVMNRSTFVEHQPLDISSSEIRKRVAEGKSVKKLVPSAVAAIIEEKSLYR